MKQTTSLPSYAQSSITVPTAANNRKIRSELVYNKDDLAISQSLFEILLILETFGSGCAASTPVKRVAVESSQIRNIGELRNIRGAKGMSSSHDLAGCCYSWLRL